MKKLKWLLLLLAACCCIGCGKGDEAAKTDKDMVEESKEDASKDKDDEDQKNKEDKKDNEDKGNKKDDEEEKKEDPKPTAKPVEKQPVPYSVTQSNKFEIDGTWYDATGTWELIIHVGTGNEFPNIAEVVLTDGDLNAAFLLDENHRESENVVYSCFFDGSRMNPKVTFTEDGIVLEHHDVLSGKVLFTRPEGYVKGAQPAGYAVTQENLSDIMGNWYDPNNQWNFFILPCNDGQFPNVGRGVLTNGVQNILLCLDERGRKSDNVIQACAENGMMYNTLVTFTEGGIKVDGIPSEGFEETVFVRDGLYSRIPVGTTNYYNMEDVAYLIIHQIVGNGKTYYLMQDAYNGELVISYENRANYVIFEDYYFVAEQAVSYYDQMLMGFSVVQLIDAELYTEEEFERYGSDDRGVDFVDKTNECYFPGYFDAAYYCADQDMWLLQAKESGTPFEVAGADVLSVENDVLQFVGRIRNTGSRKNVLIGAVTLYDKYGDEIETYAAFSAVLADDYYIDMEHDGRIRGIESLGIGAGEEAQLILVDENDEYLTGAINLSSFSDEVKYIQVMMLQWNEWTVAVDSILNQIDN